MYNIYFDSYQEGSWFKALHHNLENAQLNPFPNARELKKKNPTLQQTLSFDRPDIILCENDNPILVVERTIEVPSGHNVGQRFARLVAAAKAQVPTVYFGPYAAYKHGGSTQGPRYMNLRLVKALDSMAAIYDTPITVINWIVDEGYEIIRTPEKDLRMRGYLQLFFDLYSNTDFPTLRKMIMGSDFERQQLREREDFIEREVRNPEQYDGPPPSVKIVNHHQLCNMFPHFRGVNFNNDESVVYDIGMRYLRSDPYTGMALLYTYLYCGGLIDKTRNLILNFQNLDMSHWHEVSHRSRKDVRLYRMVSDSIIFRDGILLAGAI